MISNNTERIIQGWNYMTSYDHINPNIKGFSSVKLNDFGIIRKLSFNGPWLDAQRGATSLAKKSIDSFTEIQNNAIWKFSQLIEILKRTSPDQNFIAKWKISEKFQGIFFITCCLRNFFLYIRYYRMATSCCCWIFVFECTWSCICFYSSKDLNIP